MRSGNIKWRVVAAITSTGVSMLGWLLPRISKLTGSRAIKAGKCAKKWTVGGKLDHPTARENVVKGQCLTSNDDLARCQHAGRGGSHYMNARRASPCHSATAGAAWQFERILGPA